jgi:hypothetical protein
MRFYRFVVIILYGHTYATKLFERGASVLTVSKLLGHSSVKTTEKTYIHVLQHLKIKEVETLNDIFLENNDKLMINSDFPNGEKLVLYR